MVLRRVSDPSVVTRGGAPLFGIDANCHEPLSQVGLPLRAIWHNEDYAFWLDADDLLDPPQRIQLQALLDGLRPGDEAAYVVRCSCDPGPNGDGGQTVVDHIRLFPVREGVRWTYAVNEQILPASGGRMSRCDGPTSRSGTPATPTRRCGNASSSGIARSSMPS